MVVVRSSIDYGLYVGIAIQNVESNLKFIGMK